MTSYNGVGATDLPIEQLAAGGDLRTIDALPATNATVTRDAGGQSEYVDQTFLFEPLFAITREMQSILNVNLDKDYRDKVTDFFTNQTLSQPVTFDSFAHQFVSYVKASYQPNAALTPVLHDLETRLATALDLVVRANLGIFRNAQDLTPLQEAVYPTGTTVPDLFPQGPSVLSVVSWASNSNANIETTENTAISSTWAVDGFSTLDGFPSNVLQDISQRAFSDFFSQSFASSGQSIVEVILNSAKSYFVRFAHIPDYMNVIAAFTSNLTDPQQAEIFKNFIVNLYFNPANNNSFRLSADIGKFIDQMSANYLSALSGTATIVNSSVSGSFPKVKILQRIYALIVEMISVIQEMTAAQSNQLKLMTEQQSKMTDIINQIHIFTSGDGTVIDSADSTSNDQTARDSLNQVGAAWTDTIRANRDFVQNAAKSYQSNINTSNDAVNQQSSMATAFIQELSTLLGAIYR